MEEEYRKLKKEVEKAFKKVWGPRCKENDFDLFPDLKRKPEERCMVCSAYDKLDRFLEDLKKSL